MADYQGKLTGQYIDSIPSQFDNIIEGKTVVGLANNLFSPTDVQHNNQSFIFRTSGGSDSIRSGEAYLKKIYGNSSKATDVNGSLNLQINEQSRFNVSIDKEVFKTKVNHQLGQYDFIYNGTNWTLQSVDIVLSDYGLTVDIAYPLLNNDKFIVNYIIVMTSEEEISVSDAHVPRLTSTFNTATFKDYVKDTVQPGSSLLLVFRYDGTNWIKSGTTEIKIISDYGVTITGNVILGDSFFINYTRSNYGEIIQSTPTSFKALGLNSLNAFDANSMVLSNYTIDNNGLIISAQGKYVCYAKAAYNANNTNGYTIYDRNKTIEKVGYINSLPVAGSTVILGTAESEVSHVTFSNNCYIVCSCTNTSGICIHPTWSGYNDKVYTSYSESTIALPTLQLWAIGNTRNSYDLITKVFTKVIDRMTFTETALATLISLHPTWVNGTDYLYDNNWIYYKINSTTSTISISTYKYYVNDFSTEEFIGTNINVIADLLYGANLVDKLRNDVITTSMLTNMVVTFDDGTTATYRIVNPTNN